MAKKGLLLRKLLSILLCCVFAIGCFSGCKKRAPQLPNLNSQEIIVTPTSTVDGLIPTDAQFTIECTGNSRKLSLEQVQMLFHLKPDMGFSVKKIGKGQFSLIPDRPFDKNSIVNLHLADNKNQMIKSWAYQTQVQFSVTSTTPADQTEYVPTNSGIEVNLSHANISEEEFLNAFVLQEQNASDPVSGTVQKRGSRMVFVPSQELRASTVYTATVDSSLSTPEGDTLDKDYTFSFRTAEVRGEGGVYSYFMNASPIAETFVPGDTPVIAINCDNSYEQEKLAVSVYQFKDIDGYKLALHNTIKNGSSPFSYSSNVEIDTQLLTKITSFETPLTIVENSWGPKYVVFPEAFDEGWYYVQVDAKSPLDGEEKKVQKLIQISPLSLYYMQANNDTIFWINDSKTGEVIKDAKITCDGTKSRTAVSDGNGVVSLANSVMPDEAQEGALLTVQSGDMSYADVYFPQHYYEKSAREKYVSYISTDRPIYMSTDTIKVWGVVRPRESGQGQPGNVQIVLGDYSEDYYTVPVSPSSDGTFISEISFEKMSGQEERYARVSLRCGEEELNSTSVSIADYVKPVYVPHTSVDKVLYQGGENINFEFSASFFDNTPAEGFSADLNVNSYGWQDSLGNYSLVTDQEGKARQEIQLPMQLSNNNSWRPTGIYYSVMNTSGENENFTAEGYIHAIFRDKALRIESQGEDGDKRVFVKTNEIDITDIKTEKDFLDEENLIGSTCDLPITVEIHKEYYTKSPNGSYYDYIRKKNIELYDYHFHDDIISTDNYQTKGGILEINNLPESDSEGTFYIKVSTKDTMGRVIEERFWLGSRYNYWNMGTHRYSFDKQQGGDIDSSEYYNNKYRFTDNETAIFHLLDNGVPVTQGRVMWSVVQQGISSYQVDAKPQIKIPFDEKLVPNYTLVGAYFDGKYIYPIQSLDMGFNPEQRDLNIQMKADKENYAPGDTVEMEITVAYKKNQLPAENAAVSLCLVDEAVFAIQDRDVTILEDLYHSAHYPTIYQYVSYHQYNFNADMAGEKGGGGGNAGIRSDFQDTAAFLTASTNEQGIAHLSFPLPDNITSWRATAQAVTQDLSAGYSTQDVIVTGRFFINEVMSNQLIEGDDATVTLRCAGNSITADSAVDYQVLVVGDGIENESTFSGKAGDRTVLPIGKLPKGHYTVTMSARSGELADAIQKPLDVVQSGVEASLTKTIDLNEGIDIEPEKFPVIMGFYDADYQNYSKVFEHVSVYFGNRTDERIARKFVSDKITELSDGVEIFGFESEDTLDDVIFTQGAVSLYPYDSNDVFLAAKTHVAVPEYLVGGNPFGTFESVVSGTDSPADAVCAAYLGLAAHKQPVLGDILALLEGDNGNTPTKNNLYLMAALAVIGDTDGAKSYYDTIVVPNLSRATSADGADMCWLGVDGEIEEGLELTALASMTASMIRSDDAHGMMEYIIQHPSVLNLHVLEEIIYLQYMQPQGERRAVVTYQRNGKKETLDLGRLGMTFVRFASPDFKNANLKVQSGNAWAKVFYIGNIQEMQQQENKGISVIRSIAPVRGDGATPGSIVKIMLTPMMDDTIDPSNLILNDYIPSGMRYLGLGSAQDGYGKYSDNSWRLVNREGQRVTFSYWDMDTEAPTDENGAPLPGEMHYAPVRTLTYYARCATPGDYIVDSAYVRAAKSPVWGCTERERFVIDP